MKTVIKTLLFSFLILSFVSCSIMQHNIRKNDSFAKKPLSSLFQKNGNVFLLDDTYSVYSVVWSYNSEGKVEIYKLIKGKVYERKEYPNNGISNYQIPTSKELGLDIGTICGFVLDGDGFAFKIKRGSEIEEFGWGGIKCLINNTFQADFLNKIVSDIITYKMWDIQYQ